MDCSKALDHLLDVLQQEVSYLRREGFDVQRRGGGDLEIEVVRLPAQAPPPERGLIESMMDAQARELGYTGEICPQCGSHRMKAAGACSACEECGTSGGCG
jgi:hypothetical protein